MLDASPSFHLAGTFGQAASTSKIGRLRDWARASTPKRNGNNPTATTTKGATALKFNFDDLDTVAAEALTEGGDDKKCDVAYIDRDEKLAVVIQSYFSTSDKPE